MKRSVAIRRLEIIRKKLEEIQGGEFGDEFDSLLSNASMALELAERELRQRIVIKVDPRIPKGQAKLTVGDQIVGTFFNIGDEDQEK